MRVLTIVMLTLAALVAGAAPALAHVALVPSEISPEGPTSAQLVVTHGCGEDGQIPKNEDAAAATSTVSVDVPSPLEVTPEEVEGWSLSFDGAAGQVRWTHDDPAGAEGTVMLDLVVAASQLAEGEEVWLPVTQECVDDSRMVWDHVGEASTVTELPAALGQIAAPADEASAGAGGLSTPGVIALAVSLAVVAGGVVVVVSCRKAR